MTPVALRRRAFLLGTMACVASPSSVRASTTRHDKRLENRLRLWANYAERTQVLVARTLTRRESALLEAPLVTGGTLFFRAPSSLLLRDDGPLGSTTLVEEDAVRMLPHRPVAGTEAPLDPVRHPGAVWLAERLVRLFGPGDPARLLAETEARVPSGRGYRLELCPLPGSEPRQVIRSLTVHLDPVEGAITRLDLAEAQGDLLRIGLSDHRREVDPDDVRTAFEEANALAQATRR